MIQKNQKNNVPSSMFLMVTDISATGRSTSNSCSSELCNFTDMIDDLRKQVTRRRWKIWKWSLIPWLEPVSKSSMWSKSECLEVFLCLVLNESEWVLPQTVTCCRSFPELILNFRFVCFNTSIDEIMANWTFYTSLSVLALGYCIGNGISSTAGSFKDILVFMISSRFNILVCWFSISCDVHFMDLVQFINIC